MNFQSVGTGQLDYVFLWLDKTTERKVPGMNTNGGECNIILLISPISIKKQKKRKFGKHSCHHSQRLRITVEN